LTISSLALTNSADYIVVVTNLPGSATSTVATLTVIDPLITQEPAPAGLVTVYEQSSAQWTVGILGTPPLTKQWQGSAPDSGFFTNLINGGQISGANSTVLTIANLDLANGGDYRFIVSNVSGSVTSRVVSLVVQAIAGPAQAYTLDFVGAPIQQPQGADWNTLANWNPDGDSAANSAPAHPGSTYTVLPGARLRCPTNVNNIFPGALTPGIQLMVNGIGVWTNNPPVGDLTMGELRFKHSGGPGTNYFRKLVMNGGQIDNGDAGFCVIQGEMDILANTPIFVDSGGATNRGYRIEASLTGSANLEYYDFDATLGSLGGLNIAGTSNTFSGTWHVARGVLLGSGPNSLGTNVITVDAGGALETTYNLNTPSANLVLNGKLFLHQADTFRTVMIGSYLLPAGTYPYAQLASSFPGNFPAAWAQQNGSGSSTASGSITVLLGPVINPINVSYSVQGPNLVLNGAGGLANGSFRILTTTNLALPKASWTQLGPYPFDGLGLFSVGFPENPGTPRQFFQLQQQVP
jgi:hypothetical protein